MADFHTTWREVMALSDAKSIPIDNAIAALQASIVALKAHKQLVLAYNDTTKDRDVLVAKLEAARLIAYGDGEGRTKIASAQLVNACLDVVPPAPQKRKVQSPRTTEAKEARVAPERRLSEANAAAAQRAIVYGGDRR